jgi:hypothetical protein
LQQPQVAQNLQLLSDLVSNMPIGRVQALELAFKRVYLAKVEFRFFQ